MASDQRTEPGVVGGHQRERLLRTLAAATFIIFFQAYMVAPIMPALSNAFGTSVETVGLIVPAYLIPYGVATLAYGLLADRLFAFVERLEDHDAGLHGKVGLPIRLALIDRFRLSMDRPRSTPVFHIGETPAHRHDATLTVFRAIDDDRPLAPDAERVDLVGAGLVTASTTIALAVDGERLAEIYYDAEPSSLWRTANLLRKPHPTRARQFVDQRRIMGRWRGDRAGMAVPSER